MKLGEIIRRWRLMAERDMRSVALEMGISAETLRRFEQGSVPDGATLAKILAWALKEQQTEQPTDIQLPGSTFQKVSESHQEGTL